MRVLFPLLVASAACAAPAITHLGGFACEHGLTAGAGFLSYAPVSGGVLIVTQFTGDPLESDAISTVPGLDALLASGNVSSGRCSLLTDAISWPNDAEPVALPLGSGDVVHGILAPGGFLVPPKTIGAVTLINSSSLSGPTAARDLFTLSAPKVLPGDGWFYHRALPFDVDGDGLIDVLAARATKPLVEAPQGELVWMRQPNVAAPLAPGALPWEEKVLVSGAWSPDVFFTSPLSLRGDADSQLFHASFFTGGGLAMVQCSGCAASGASAPHTWATAPLAPTVLDAGMGPGFDVEVVDLDGDGTLDLLVTNHVDVPPAPNDPSEVVAYVAPAAPTPLTDASAWTKHVLASNFTVREPGPNQAAPGGARSMAAPGGSSKRPWVTVSGDGDQRAYILSPVSEDVTSWEYDTTLVWDCKGTVGRQVSVVVGGESFVLIPCYDSGRIEAFRVE